jgi:hypothetical protein
MDPAPESLSPTSKINAAARRLRRKGRGDAHERRATVTSMSSAAKQTNEHEEAGTAEEFVRLPADQLAELLARDEEAEEDGKHGKLIPAADVLARFRRA